MDTTRTHKSRQTLLLKFSALIPLAAILAGPFSGHSSARDTVRSAATYVSYTLPEIKQDRPLKFGASLADLKDLSGADYAPSYPRRSRSGSERQPSKSRYSKSSKSESVNPTSSSSKSHESGGSRKRHFLGDATKPAEFPDKPKEFFIPPTRPKLSVEVGNGFLSTGLLDLGFEVPLLGAVWQPRLWVYNIFRSTIQTFDGGGPTGRDTEFANRWDLFANLQLTGTEKILLNLRPLDRNSLDEFTRYSFNDRGGDEKGWETEFDFDIESLFFEGDLGSLFPKLDPGGFIPVDFGFTVGRQAVTFQEGILLNDTLDMVGFVRNNMYLPGISNYFGISNLRISGAWAWDRNSRGLSDDSTNLFSLFTAADTKERTVNIDTIYVDDDGRNSAAYLGLASIQRIGLYNTAFRANTSWALDEEAPTVGRGSLLSAEVSWTPFGSDDIVYVNPFLALGNYTQAGREPILGGPLASLGILFAGPTLSNYRSELNGFTNDVLGAAVGYQAFWDNHRRNLALEIAGRKDHGGEGVDSAGVGFQLQQAVGQHHQFQLESFYSVIEEQDNASGARVEWQLVY